MPSINLHEFQATDVFAAFLFYLEGNAVASGLTLAFVFAPGIFIFTTEAAKVGRQITYMRQGFSLANASLISTSSSGIKYE